MRKTHTLVWIGIFLLTFVIGVAGILWLEEITWWRVTVLALAAVGISSILDDTIIRVVFLGRWLFYRTFRASWRKCSNPGCTFGLIEEIRMICSECKGSGEKSCAERADGTIPDPCRRCGGRGATYRKNICPICGGKSRIPPD